MKTLGLVVLLSGVMLPAAAPVDDMIERLATCQVSWRDWKNDPVQSQKMAALFNGVFVNPANDGSFSLKEKVVVAGLPVLQVYPESVGMGVGFSVVLGASFDSAREHVQKATGKTLGDCDTSDGMRTCGVEIARERTITLMAAENSKEARTLLGCFYVYEK